MPAEITVVIPIWDRYVPLLETQVRSVREMQKVATHVVVVDNASTVPLPPLPPEVQVVRLPRRVTTGAARNAGLTVVHSPYVTFLDADDTLAPGALDLLLADATQCPGLVAAVGSMEAYHPFAGVRTALPFPTEWAQRAQWAPLALGTLSIVRNCFPTVGPAVLATDAVRDAGGFADASYCEDWSLATALAFRGPVHLRRDHLMSVQFHWGSQITRHGTPQRMLRQLFRLHGRWYRDPCVPVAVKLVMPLLMAPRLFKSLRRLVSGEVSHSDLLDAWGRPSLTPPQESQP